ncbi:MAG TPA: 8-amino-7-oxononanoate synthase [Puia sp.]|nr:8-amino-7-oxononanoate synthase [Puia sp.]
MKEDFIDKKLEERELGNAYRRLRLPDGRIDFCSNDYLGLVTNDLFGKKEAPTRIRPLRKGSTGSRLLAGNYPMIEETEKMVAEFHQAEEGLIFNSGYDANLGLLSAVPQRGDTIIYDSLSHASIRDGIRLSFAQSFPFYHNDILDLEKKLGLATGNIFIVTESVFSMDGDMAPLKEIVALTSQFGAQLIVDEAHATGVIGEKGEGRVQQLGLQKNCFARVHTFGKALGCHGAIVLGSKQLRDYLINFSRPFIYTTALPEASMDAIQSAYELFPQLNKERYHLGCLIRQFQKSVFPFERCESNTPIQAVIVPGNTEVKALAQKLQERNLDIRSILYPSVPKGRERLRIVLHSFNTTEQLSTLEKYLAQG